jgi:SAM-dependent methyltransferase
MKSVLAIPRVYDLFQDLLGGKRSRQHFVERHVRAQPGDCVLDIGCGTAQLLKFLPDVNYFGFDADAKYIDAARARHGSRGVFLHDTVTERSLEGIPPCDIVVATGVLHHLDDHAANHLFKLAHSALKPGGRLVTFDMCLEDGQSPVARFLVMKDRGDHMRYARQYHALAAEVFQDARYFIYHRLLRVPYTMCALELKKV